MPWTTLTLKDVRKRTRDYVTAYLNTTTITPNSVLRIVSDAMSGLAHLTLQYLDWQARQYLPDTAETEWLDRHGQIWLKNSDGSKGRKSPTFAFGTVTMVGIIGSIVPTGTRLARKNIEYETLAAVALADVPTPISIRALDAGSVGNAEIGDTLSLTVSVDGVDSDAVVVELSGGTDEENDAELRSRILLRIQNPPMGGDEIDYIEWAKAVPGVTRAWAYPLEQGMGTVTVRFMADDLRADAGGFPELRDIEAVEAYLDTVRPVTVKDFFVVSPIPFEISLTITDLSVDSEAVRADIEASIRDMLRQRARPGATIYASWVSEAISAAVGEDHHTLTFPNTPMPSPGHIPVLGSIHYG